MSLSACALGALLGTPLAWFIWQGSGSCWWTQRRWPWPLTPMPICWPWPSPSLWLSCCLLCWAAFCGGPTSWTWSTSPGSLSPSRAVPRWYGPLGIILLAAGGVLYTGGVAFYALNKIHYMHSVWHLFVLGGSICQYLSIALYVIPATF